MKNQNTRQKSLKAKARDNHRTAPSCWAGTKFPVAKLLTPKKDKFLPE